MWLQPPGEERKALTYLSKLPSLPHPSSRTSRSWLMGHEGMLEVLDFSGVLTSFQTDFQFGGAITVSRGVAEALSVHTQSTPVL